MYRALIALACLLAVLAACAIVQIGDDPTLRRIGIGNREPGGGTTTTTTTQTAPQQGQAASAPPGAKP